MNNTTLRDDLRPAAADQYVPATVIHDHVEAGGFGWPVSGDLTTIEHGVPVPKLRRRLRVVAVGTIWQGPATADRIRK